MSRIGKKEIKVPANIKVETGDNVFISNGNQTLNVAIPKNIKTEYKDNVIKVFRDNNENKVKSLHGLIRTLIANAVNGFSKPFEKKLNIKGVGYKVNVDGKNVVLNVGYSHPVRLSIPEYIDVKVDPKGVEVLILGIDKMKVGEFASKIKRVCPPEPYKGTGIMYQDEKIIRKAGKSASK